MIVAVYAIAAAVAAATLYGAIRLFARGHRQAVDGTEADAPAARLDVLTRRRVGHGRSLVVVEVEGRRLLLGSTKGAWTALADLGRPAPTPEGQEAADTIEAELNRAINSTRFRRGGRSR